MSNEAAERLREWLTESHDRAVAIGGPDALDKALAAERKTTVELLIDKHGCRDSDLGIPCGWHSGDLDFLDAEAKR